MGQKIITGSNTFNTADYITNLAKSNSLYDQRLYNTMDDTQKDVYLSSLFANPKNDKVNTSIYDKLTLEGKLDYLGAASGGYKLEKSFDDTVKDILEQDQLRINKKVYDNLTNGQKFLATLNDLMLSPGEALVDAIESVADLGAWVTSSIMHAAGKDITEIDEFIAKDWIDQEAKYKDTSSLYFASGANALYNEGTNFASFSKSLINEITDDLIIAGLSAVPGLGLTYIGTTAAGRSTEEVTQQRLSGSGMKWDNKNRWADLGYIATTAGVSMGIDRIIGRAFAKRLGKPLIGISDKIDAIPFKHALSYGATRAGYNAIMQGSRAVIQDITRESMRTAWFRDHRFKLSSEQLLQSMAIGALTGALDGIVTTLKYNAERYTVINPDGSSTILKRGKMTQLASRMKQLLGKERKGTLTDNERGELTKLNNTVIKLNRTTYKGKNELDIVKQDKLKQFQETLRKASAEAIDMSNEYTPEMRKSITNIRKEYETLLLADFLPKSKKRVKEQQTTVLADIASAGYGNLNRYSNLASYMSNYAKDINKLDKQIEKSEDDTLDLEDSRSRNLATLTLLNELSSILKTSSDEVIKAGSELYSELINNASNFIDLNATIQRIRNSKLFDTEVGKVTTPTPELNAVFGDEINSIVPVKPSTALVPIVGDKDTYVVDTDIDSSVMIVDNKVYINSKYLSLLSDNQMQQEVSSKIIANEALRALPIDMRSEILRQLNSLYPDGMSDNVKLTESMHLALFNNPKLFSRIISRKPGYKKELFKTINDIAIKNTLPEAKPVKHKVEGTGKTVQAERQVAAKLVNNWDAAVVDSVHSQEHADEVLPKANTPKAIDESTLFAQNARDKIKNTDYSTMRHKMQVYSYRGGITDKRANFNAAIDEIYDVWGFRFKENTDPYTASATLQILDPQNWVNEALPTFLEIAKQARPDSVTFADGINAYLAKFHGFMINKTNGDVFFISDIEACVDVDKLNNLTKSGQSALLTLADVSKQELIDMFGKEVLSSIFIQFKDSTLAEVTPGTRGEAAPNVIVIDSNNLETAPHEIGHAISNLSGLTRYRDFYNYTNDIKQAVRLCLKESNMNDVINEVTEFVNNIILDNETFRKNKLNFEQNLGTSDINIIRRETIKAVLNCTKATQTDKDRILFNLLFQFAYENNAPGEDAANGKYFAFTDSIYIKREIYPNADGTYSYRYITDGPLVSHLNNKYGKLGRNIRDAKGNIINVKPYAANEYAESLNATRTAAETQYGVLQERHNKRQISDKTYAGATGAFLTTWLLPNTHIQGIILDSCRAMGIQLDHNLTENELNKLLPVVQENISKYGGKFAVSLLDKDAKTLIKQVTDKFGTLDNYAQKTFDTLNQVFLEICGNNNFLDINNWQKVFDKLPEHGIEIGNSWGIHDISEDTIKDIMYTNFGLVYSTKTNKFEPIDINRMSYNGALQLRLNKHSTNKLSSNFSGTIDASGNIYEANIYDIQARLANDLIDTNTFNTQDASFLNSSYFQLNIHEEDGDILVDISNFPSMADAFAVQNIILEKLKPQDDVYFSYNGNAYKPMAYTTMQQSFAATLYNKYENKRPTADNNYYISNGKVYNGNDDINTPKEERAFNDGKNIADSENKPLDLEFSFNGKLPINLDASGLPKEVKTDIDNAGAAVVTNNVYLPEYCNPKDIAIALRIAQDLGIDKVSVDGEEVFLDEMLIAQRPQYRESTRNLNLPWSNPGLKSYKVLESIAKKTGIYSIDDLSKLGFDSDFINAAKSHAGISYTYLLDIINKRTACTTNAINLLIAEMYPNNIAMRTIQNCETFLTSFYKYVPLMSRDEQYDSFEKVVAKYTPNKMSVVQSPNDFYTDLDETGLTEYEAQAGRYLRAMIDATQRETAGTEDSGSEINNMWRAYSTLLNGNYIFSVDDFDKFVKEAKVKSGFVSGLLKTQSSTVGATTKDGEEQVDITDRQVARDYAAGKEDFAEAIANQLNLSKKYIDNLKAKQTPLEKLAYAKKIVDRYETKIDETEDIYTADKLRDQLDSYYTAYEAIRMYVSRLPKEERTKTTVQENKEFKAEIEKIKNMSPEERTAYAKKFTNTDRFINRERFTEEERKEINKLFIERGAKDVTNAQSALSKVKSRLPNKLSDIGIDEYTKSVIINFINTKIKSLPRDINQAKNLRAINDFVQQLPAIANKLKGAKGVYFDEAIYNKLLDNELEIIDDTADRPKSIDFVSELDNILGNIEEPKEPKEPKENKSTYEPIEKEKNIKYTVNSDLLSKDTKKALEYNTNINYESTVKQGTKETRQAIDSALFIADNAKAIDDLLDNQDAQRNFIDWYKGQTYDFTSNVHTNASLLLGQISTFSKYTGLAQEARKILTEEISAAGRTLGLSRAIMSTPVTQMAALSLEFPLTNDERLQLQDLAKQEREALSNNNFKEAFEIEKKALDIFAKYDKGVKVNVFEKGITKEERIKRGKSLLKRIDAFRYLAMLSNPKTFLIKNEASNAISTATDTVATAIGNFISDKENKRLSGIQYKQAKRTNKSNAVVEKHLVNSGLLDGLVEGKIQRSGTKFTVRTSKIRPGKLSSEFPTDEQDLSWVDDSNIQKNSDKPGELDLNMSQENRLFRNRKTFGDSGFGNVLNKLQDIVYGTMDKFDRKHVSKYTVKRASELVAGSFTETELDNLTSNNPDENLINRLNDIIEYSFTEALKTYFKYTPKFYEAYQRFESQHPGLRIARSIIMPFPRFAINAAQMAFEYGPTGIAKGLYGLFKAERQEKQTKQDREAMHNSDQYQNANKQQQEQMDKEFDAGHAQDPFTSMKVGKDLGKGITGTMLLALGAVLGAVGILRLDDEKPYLGPQLYLGDFHIDISDLSPSLQALLLGGILTMGEGGGINAMLNSYTDAIFLGDITGMLKDNVADTFKSLGSNYAMSFIPSVIKSLAKVIDPRDKATDSKFIKKFAAALPGISYAVPSKIDPYTGNNKYMYAKNQGAGTILAILNGFISPGPMYSTSGSNIEKEAKRVGATTDGPNSKFTVGEEQYQLKGKELEEYQRERARLVYELSQALIKTTEYQEADDKTKAKMLKKVYSEATEQAKANYVTSK